jgi:putative FmdB family regulatory protein
MPVYEYKCCTCGETFDVVAPFAEREAKAVCPACGRRDVAQCFGTFTSGIRRTRFNPGTFVRRKGQKPEHKPGKEG